MKLRAPFPYFGGKSRVAPEIWERFGAVVNYVEPFAGSLAVLLARPQPFSGTETINDVDAHLTNFWRAVQAEPESVAHHADWPVSELDLHARHLWLVNDGRQRVERLRTDPEYYDPQSAGWWVWGICNWIGSGFCSGKGPLRLPESDGQELNGVAVQLPHLGDAGQGVHKKLPHLGDGGMGIHCGRHSVSRQLPALVIGGGAGVSGFSYGENCAGRQAGLRIWMQALCDRLCRVRITCGDWTRVCGPSVTTKHGLTAVLLDPPYVQAGRHDECYNHDTACAGAVRAWALEHSDDQLLRIAYCGYDDGTVQFPDTWECLSWKTPGGYGSQGEGRGRDNSHRERIWFSPHCQKTNRSRQMTLTASLF